MSLSDKMQARLAELGVHLSEAEAAQVLDWAERLKESAERLKAAERAAT
ncbi:hypothetical protein ACXN5S_13345 [Pseudoroseicyclus sp. H15]